MTSGRGAIARRRRVGWRSLNHEVVCGRWGFPRRRHSHRPSSDDLGFVVVTHPFHPLIGQRLEILYVKRRGADEVFVVDDAALEDTTADDFGGGGFDDAAVSDIGSSSGGAFDDDWDTYFDE